MLSAVETDKHVLDNTTIHAYLTLDKTTRQVFPLVSMQKVHT